MKDANPTAAAPEAIDSPTAPQRSVLKKVAFMGGLLAATIIGFVLLKQYGSIDYLASQEQSLKALYDSNPVLVIGAAFLIYMLATGLSLPGAALMSLLFAWFFGFPVSLVLVSFASTAGATMAFLISRYLFRDWINARFGSRLQSFNEALEKEGAFYLFTLRLIPLVPFFVINAVMGLTKLRATTFWWVSQVGMLAGTAVYCYAGSRVPDLQSIKENGINAVFNPTQMTQILIAFALLGVFPIAVKKLLEYFRPTAVAEAR